MEDVRKRYTEYKRRRKEAAGTREDSQSEERRTETRATATEGAISDSPPQPAHASQEDEGESSKEHESTVPNTTHPPTPPSPSPPPLTTPTYTTLLLKGLLWALLWGFFIEVGFGAVFFITSLLYLIIVSLRGSRRNPWEPSAYSVFNRNFEAIEGTLSAEQFERELRYGPASVKK